MKISADEFNEQYEIGQEVAYFPVTGEQEFLQTETRTPAWELGHGEPVVSVKGRSGGVCLSNVEILSQSTKGR